MTNYKAKFAEALKTPKALKNIAERPRLPVSLLQENSLYQIVLDSKLNKTKLRFYWNNKLNPLILPPTKGFDEMTHEENGGEIIFLKNFSNVIFIAYRAPYSVFYSLDKQRIVFRNGHKCVTFIKV